MAFYHEQTAFYYEKRPFLANLSDFGISSHLWLFIMKKRPFLTILSIFGIFSHLWLFIKNRRLFIMKKDRFWPIYRISVFLVICGFLS